MVVAVTVVRVMQVTVDEVVDVVAMRNRLVTAAGSMLMVGGVCTTVMVWRARGRVGATLSERVLVDVVSVDVMKMPVVQVVDVAVVGDRGMAAVGAVLMGVSFVTIAAHAFIGAHAGIVAK